MIASVKRLARTWAMSTGSRPEPDVPCLPLVLPFLSLMLLYLPLVAPFLSLTPHYLPLVLPFLGLMSLICLWYCRFRCCLPVVRN